MATKVSQVCKILLKMSEENRKILLSMSSYFLQRVFEFVEGKNAENLDNDQQRRGKLLFIGRNGVTVVHFE